jgi:hypothetical protein
MRHEDPSRRSARFACEALEDRCVPAAVGTANQNFIDQLYRDILHRAPDPTGMAGWVAALDNGTSRGSIVDGFFATDEGTHAEINDLYLRFLHRSADAQGMTGWTNYLRDHHTNLELAAQLLASPEYYQTRAGGTDAGFLNALYEDILCRPISADDISDRHDDFSNGFNSRVQIAENVLESSEAEGMRDQHSVRSYLRQDVTASQAQNIVNNGENGGGHFDNNDAVFSGTLLSSSQYYNLSQTLTTTDFATIPSCDNIDATTGMPTTTTTLA